MKKTPESNLKNQHNKRVKATKTKKQIDRLKKLETQVNKGGKSGSKALYKIAKKKLYQFTDEKSLTNYIRNRDSIKISQTQRDRFENYFRICEELCLDPTKYTEGLLRELVPLLGNDKEIKQCWDKIKNSSEKNGINKESISKAILWTKDNSLSSDLKEEDLKILNRMKKLLRKIDCKNNKERIVKFLLKTI
jgi:hypothetical protein